MHHYQYPDTLIEWSASLDTPVLATPTAAAQPAVPPASVQDLATLLLARRSIRSYSARAIPAKVLGAITALAAQVNPLREQGGGLGLRLKLWAVVAAGAGDLAPGVYRWHDDALQRHGDALTPAQMESLGQQKGFARAPVVLLVTADFEHTVRHFAARGYREMLMRAGAMLRARPDGRRHLGRGRLPVGRHRRRGLGAGAGHRPLPRLPALRGFPGVRR